MKSAFTLLELLVAVAILAVLVGLAIPATTHVSQYAARVKEVSNLRQLGVAAHLYANDHNQELPGHPAPGVLSDPNVAGGTWPQLFCQYLSPSDPRVFLDPQDRQTARLPLDVVLSSEVNNTGYVCNGFDDLASEGQVPSMIPLSRLPLPAQTILLGPKTQGATGFYVDVLLQPLADLLNEFNPAVYDGGAHYLFVDGSVRFFKQADYSDSFWLSDKSIRLPSLPSAPVFQSLPRFAGARSPRGDRWPLFMSAVVWR